MNRSIPNRPLKNERIRSTVLNLALSTRAGSCCYFYNAELHVTVRQQRQYLLHIFTLRTSTQTSLALFTLRPGPIMRFSPKSTNPSPAHEQTKVAIAGLQHTLLSRLLLRASLIHRHIHPPSSSRERPEGPRNTFTTSVAKFGPQCQLNTVEVAPASPAVTLLAATTHRHDTTPALQTPHSCVIHTIRGGKKIHTARTQHTRQIEKPRQNNLRHTTTATSIVPPCLIGVLVNTRPSSSSISHSPPRPSCSPPRGAPGSLSTAPTRATSSPHGWAVSPPPSSTSVITPHRAPALRRL